MKKLITALLLVSLIFTLAACGNDGDMNNGINSKIESNIDSAVNSSSAPSSSENSQITSESQSSDTNQKNSGDAKITVEQAKETALKDAGFKADEVTFLRAELDRDDGILKYEVEFKKDRIEYEYDINAETGDILWVDKDMDD